MIRQLRHPTIQTVLALGAAQTLAWGSTYYLPAILAAPIADDLGLGTSWVFGAFSVALVVSAFAGPTVGRAIDRHDGRLVLAGSNLMAAAALGTLALAEGPVVLSLAFLMLGAAMSMGLYDAAFSVLTRLYGSAARRPITGITLLAGFASTVGWPLSALFEAELGWRGACLVWMLLHLGLGLPLNRFLIPKAPPRVVVLPDAVPQGGATQGAATAGGTAAGDEPARDAAPPPPPHHAMAIIAFVFGAAWFSTGAMAAHLPRLLQDIGTSATAAIAAGALIGPAQVAARLIELGVLGRFHPLVTARIATLAHPLGAALLLAIGAPGAAVFALIHGGGNGLLTIARGTLPLAVFGPIGYGRRQGWLGVPARLSQASSPLLFDLLLDRYGGGALVVSGALSVLACAALFALRPVASTR
ncbi:MAG: MFS transporter [Alphaproteobacteria bacterium]|nr:MFS transporter [Alphaproteobacteria bacterium]